MTPYTSNTQLNLRIISIVVFTCICYLSIGLPLAVLPGLFALRSRLQHAGGRGGYQPAIYFHPRQRPHAGRYTDVWGPKKVVSLGIICCLMSGLFTLAAAAVIASPLAAVALLLIGRVFWGSAKASRQPGQRCEALKPSAQKLPHA